MKRYFDGKMIDAQIGADYGVEGTEVLGKLALEEMQPIVDYLNGENPEYDADRCKALETKIDKDLFAFIKRVFNMCEKNPLLETESVLQYPNLYSTKKRNDSDIIRFVNRVYRHELPGLEEDTIVSNDNFRIFSPSFFRRTKVSAGEIIVFCDYLEGHKTMVLQRQNNIKDYVFSAGNAVELLEHRTDKYNNALHVMKHFMINRSAEYFSDQNEATRQQRLYFDMLNFYIRGLSKKLKNMSCEEFNNSPLNFRLYVLDLTDRLLGFGLAADEHINLQTIMDGDIMNNEGANLESIGSSYSRVERAIWNASDELRSHPYTIKK